MTSWTFGDLGIPKMALLWFAGCLLRPDLGLAARIGQADPGLCLRAASVWPAWWPPSCGEECPLPLLLHGSVIYHPCHCVHCELVHRDTLQRDGTFGLTGLASETHQKNRTGTPSLSKTVEMFRKSGIGLWGHSDAELRECHQTPFFNSASTHRFMES